MQRLGHPMIVTDGLRTAAQQRALFAQGRTRPGAIVTNADGDFKRSNHQPRLTGPYAGFGCAADLTFLDADGRPSWAITHPWAIYGEQARALGLVWGGDWRSFKDRPHVELPQENSNA